MSRLPSLLLAFLFVARLASAADAPAADTSVAAASPAVALPAPVPASPADVAPASPAPADAWLAALTPLLVAHYQPPGELVLAWSRPRPASAPAHATLTLLNVPAELASQLLVNIRATDAAGRVTEHTLVLRAELWRDGWAPREPAVLGDPVRSGQLDLRRFDALREREAVAADPALELNFARNIPAGRLLTWRDVARRPLVRRGQPVEVSAIDGPLTVTLRALSLQDAGRGESVRVRNPETNKEFTAIVTAESRAAVRF